MSTLIVLLIILAFYIYYRFFFYSEKNKDFGNVFFLCLGSAYIIGAARFVRYGLYADAVVPFIMSFVIQFTFLYSITYFSRKFFKKNNSSKKLNNNNIKKNTKHNADSNVNIESINTKNESTKKVSDQIENISSEEEEEIYAKVSREVDSKDRKEGSWAKALIQSDGDESKAKIAYMKLRVEILKNELINIKTNSLIEKQKEEKNKFIDMEKDIQDQIAILKKRKEYDNKEEETRFFKKSKFEISMSIDLHYKKSFFPTSEEYLFSIFKDKDKTHFYYWINDSGEKIYCESVKLAKENILKHYEDFINKIKLLKEYKKNLK